MLPTRSRVRFLRGHLRFKMNATTKLVHPWHVARKGEAKVAELYNCTAELLLTRAARQLGRSNYNFSTLLHGDGVRVLHLRRRFPSCTRDHIPASGPSSEAWRKRVLANRSPCKRRCCHATRCTCLFGSRRTPTLLLRNRVVWTFGHGLHSPTRFSGRHETILWFTKGDNYTFNLDAVRVPQKYPGKRHYKGLKKGKFSGNPLGKNSK